jgi:plasmid stabilization system protein ParE
MPDTHRIVLTADALADLEAIAAFIRQNSPQNAAIVAEKILDAIDSLGSMPDRFKQVGKSRKRGTPIHSMVVRPFLVYYRVESSPPTVHVLNIRHGGRRQPRRFG